ncbi:MAG: YeeE/YedE family protein [Planctomycetota bacterium]|jgi:uncharacterized membrane protein YedE/YeeE
MKQGAILALGTVFGIGLAISGLAKPEVVLSFLLLQDFGLALLMAAAVAVSMPIYQLAPKQLEAPLLGGSFEPVARGVRPPHVVGGLLFGVGWGLSGVCPGAAFAGLGLANWPILYAVGGMLLGAYLQGVVAESVPATAVT